MIGQLPDTIHVDSKDFKLRTDYRIALRCFVAFNDPELKQSEQFEIMRRLLIIDYGQVQDIAEATEQCVNFLNLGEIDNSKPKHRVKLYDWEQDEQMIFSAVNKVAGHDIRTDAQLHWWSFMSLFNEIGEGAFSQIVSIRNKKAKHKKLEKYEQEFYNDNKAIIDLKRKKTKAELERIRIINEMYS